MPRCPTIVSNPFGNCLTNSSTCASRTTRSKSSSLISVPVFTPYRIFSRIVPLNKTGSWLTAPIWLRSHVGFKILRSVPSSVTDPNCGSYKRSSNVAMVVLPDPLLPTIWKDFDVTDRWQNWKSFWLYRCYCSRFYRQRHVIDDGTSWSGWKTECHVLKYNFTCETNNLLNKPRMQRHIN